MISTCIRFWFRVLTAGLNLGALVVLEEADFIYELKVFKETSKCAIKQMYIAKVFVYSDWQGIFSTHAYRISILITFKATISTS